jgi:hypothetical protein
MPLPTALFLRLSLSAKLNKTICAEDPCGYSYWHDVVQSQMCRPKKDYLSCAGADWSCDVTPIEPNNFEMKCRKETDVCALEGAWDWILKGPNRCPDCKGSCYWSPTVEMLVIPPICLCLWIAAIIWIVRCCRKAKQRREENRATTAYSDPILKTGPVPYT